MEKPIDFAVGGQALIEGVMIRSPSWITIAVRKPNGEIVKKEQRYVSLTKRVKILGLPVIRGVILLVEQMTLGIGALNFSAEQALEEDEKEETKKPMSKTWQTLSFVASILVSIFLALFLFKFLPLFATEQLQKIWPLLKDSTLLFNLTDGVVRITVFFLYILILSRIPTFQRVFQYHGAEHKSVFAYEKKLPLTPEHVKPESPRHPRCGTSFIIIVLLVSIVLLSFVPKHPVFYIHLLRRIAIIPLIMGIGYEVLKYTAKFRDHFLVRMLTYPGIATQYLTTREPDEKQIEVALVALKEAVELERQHSAK